MPIQDWFLRVSVGKLSRRRVSRKRRRKSFVNRSLRFEQMEGRRLLAVVATGATEYVTHDDVLESYSDGFAENGAPVTFSATSSPSNGSLSFDSDGSFAYTPSTGFVGTDSFDFEVSNGTDVDSATVTIQVENAAPVADSQPESVLHDTVLTSWVYADDDDGDELTFAVTSGPSNGTLALCTDGSYTYSPNAGFVGTDTIEFSASDGIEFDTGTITIDVHNTAPEAGHDSYDVEDIGNGPEAYGNILDDDTDDDTDDLTAIIETLPSEGTLYDSNNVALLVGDEFDGEFEYVANTTWPGTDSFSYRAFDGADQSEIALVALVDPNTPLVSVTGDSKFEGETLTFTFTVAAPGGVLAAPVVVNYYTDDGTAEDGVDANGNADPAEDSDYTRKSGQITFAPGGPLTKTINVVTHDETDPNGNNVPTVEANESMSMELGMITGGHSNLFFDSAVGYILNDDVVINMLNGSMEEDEAGFLYVRFDTSGIDTVIGNGLSVVLTGNTADGTAEDGVDANGNPDPAEDDDYVPSVNKQITLSAILAGQIADDVDLNFDLMEEGDEYFYYDVVLDTDNTSAQAEVSIGPSRATLTIEGDDPS